MVSTSIRGAKTRMVERFLKLLLWMQLQQQWLSEVSSVNDFSQSHHHIQFPQCRIGYIKGNSSANHNRQTLSSCQARGYQDRPNIHHILQEFEARRSFFSASLVTFFSSLTTETDITNLIFLGDSVSSQLFHFLFCDFYHSKLFKISGIQWVNQSCQFCVSYVDISIPSSSPKLLRLYNRQFNLPCLHDSHGNHEKCDDRRESEELSATFIRRLVSPLLSRSPPSVSPSSASSPLSQQSVIILNYGLHVLTPKIADWSLRGMIRGIVQMSATRQRNVSFFYRETSSQVFASARGNPSSSQLAHLSALSLRWVLHSKFRNPGTRGHAEPFSTLLLSISERPL
jgi:hypothetical protein